MSKKLKGLKQIHLSRLSPVMWSLKGGYPRKAMTVPIESVGGMGGDDDGRYKSVPLDYQRQSVWNDLYRVGVLGAMSRVAPFGPAGFGGLGGPEDCTAGQIWNPAKGQCVEQCQPGYAWDAVSRMCLMPGASPPPPPDARMICPAGMVWNSTTSRCKPLCRHPYYLWDPTINKCIGRDRRTGGFMCSPGTTQDPYSYACVPKEGVSGFGTEPAPATGMSTRKWLLILGAIGLGVFLLGRRD